MLRSRESELEILESRSRKFWKRRGLDILPPIPQPWRHEMFIKLRFGSRSKEFGNHCLIVKFDSGWS